MRLFRLLLALLLCTALFAQDKAPENKYDVAANYTKYEYRISMRDGVHLLTVVYIPNDASKSYPVLLTRTPYSVAPYGADHYSSHLGPSEAFMRAGYIFVLQDVRGRYQSEGTFVEERPNCGPKPNCADESTDMHDSVEWLLHNVPNNNGRVGIWGISYPGFFTSASIINSHPAIKAASPEAPMADLFMGDDAYHGGAMMLDANFNFYTFFHPRGPQPELPSNDRPEFKYGTTDGYDYFLRVGPELTSIAAQIKNPLFDDTYQHDTYDEYWRSRDLATQLKNVKCAVLTVGGWFDAEDLAAPFRTFHAIEKNDPGIFNAIAMGPWVHGGWARLQGSSLGRVHFNSATGDYYREHIIFPFFEQFLKGSPDAHLSKAYVFETGSNVWKQYDAWPPQNTKQRQLYLRAGGRLSFDPPAANEPAFAEYTSDPAHPVPYVNYATLDTPQEYMLSDQRFAAKRPDVLTFVSAPLEEDITVAGPVAPHLRVSSSSTDSDFDVKLIDVFPEDYPASTQKDEARPNDVPMPGESMGGYQMLIRGEPFRARFRNSWTNPEPLRPNQVTNVDFSMPDVNHTFRRGHRIMVQVQSSWFPLADLSPQQFIDPAKAKKSDFIKATERVYHSAQSPSSLLLNVLDSH